MARKAETAEVKAFKATLKGLSSDESTEFMKQFNDLQLAVATAKEKNEIRKSLAALPTEELRAELERRKNSN